MARNRKEIDGVLRNWIRSMTASFQRYVAKRMPRQARGMKSSFRRNKGAVTGNPVINYQSSGVKPYGSLKGKTVTKKINTNTPYKFSAKTPPAKAFTRYAKKGNGSPFAIAKYVQATGLASTNVVKHGMKKTFGSKSGLDELAKGLATVIKDEIVISLKKI